MGALAAGVPGAGAAAAVSSAPLPPRVTRSVLSIPAGTPMRAVADAVDASGGRVVKQFGSVGALVADLPPGAVLPAGVVSAPDRRVRTTATALPGPAAVPPSGATLRETVGATSAASGAGVTVAVLDTGVADVADLAGSVVGHLNVSDGPAGDGYGHGTFMAGLVAGSGAGSGGTYMGVAPGAKILDVQVADADGATSLSTVLAGVDAVSRWHAADPTLRVLNLSLSSGSPLPPALDPLALALDQLWRQGIVVVVSAGNDGPARGSVSSPGNDPLLLTAGALDEQGTGSRADDTVAGFSARGGGGSGAKPDLVAPGASVVSLRDPGSAVDVENPQARVGAGYFRGSGSSMSAAVVSGAAAALLSARPGLSAGQVKRLLVGTAYRGDGLSDPLAAGAGGVSVRDAVAAKSASPAHPTPAASTSPYGPAGADADAWAAFASAWADGSSTAAGAAWASLSPQTQRWASNAWAADVALHSLGLGDDTFQARAWSARAWSADDWSARAWSADAWLARAWSARAWSSDDWSARAWSARAWSARAWSDQEWASWLWSARAWSARAWSARAWSAEAWPAGERTASSAWATWSVPGFREELVGR